MNDTSEVTKLAKTDKFDGQFKQIQHDKRYQQLNLQISEEFAKADWEAWQIQLNKGIKDL